MSEQTLNIFSYVARQPILDDDRNILAYELFFRDGKQDCFPSIDQDEATSKLIADGHLTTGLEDITGGVPAFLNFYEHTLINEFPTALDPKGVVIEIVETAPISDELFEACKRIKKMGYRIALDDHDLDPKWDIFIPWVDIIKVDVQDSEYEHIAANVQKFFDAGIKLVAEKIETYEEYKQYRQLGFEYFQGYFFAKPEVIKNKALPASKMQLIELMSESSKAELDIDRVNDIIERDVSLSYMLLRFINNPMSNKKYKISSLIHALNYMGQAEVKKFIALLALANLGDDKPMELTKLSLVRAKFCELLAKEMKDSENPPKGFLVGLFSSIDALLDQDMRKLVSKLPIMDDLKSALCGESNQLRLYLEIAKSFETANWLTTQRIAKKLNIQQRTIHGLYNQAIVWSNSMRTCI